MGGCTPGKEEIERAIRAHKERMNDRIKKAKVSYKNNPVPGGFVMYLQSSHELSEQERLAEQKVLDNCCQICEFFSMGCIYCKHYKTQPAIRKHRLRRKIDK